jgi:hypothetical protein
MFEPAALKAKVMARPMPPAPPVTMVVLPVNEASRLPSADMGALSGMRDYLILTLVTESVWLQAISMDIRSENTKAATSMR